MPDHFDKKKGKAVQPPQALSSQSNKEEQMGTKAVELLGVDVDKLTELLNKALADERFTAS